jgi:hypothetical protein
VNWRNEVNLVNVVNLVIPANLATRQLLSAGAASIRSRSQRGAWTGTGSGPPKAARGDSLNSHKMTACIQTDGA